MTVEDSTDASVMARIGDARDTGEWPRVLGLLREHWNELTHRAPHDLLDLLISLPREVMEQNSRLRLAEQHLRRTLHREPETRAYSDIIADDPRASAVDRLASMTGRIAAARGAGRHDDAATATDRAIAALRGLPVEVIPSFANALPDFHYHWGVAYLLVSRFADAMEQFTQSRDWAASVNNHMVVTRSIGAAALVHALHGRMKDATEWLQRLPEVPEDAWWAVSARTPAKLAESIIHIERLEVDAARVILAGIDITTSLDYWGPYFAVRAFITPDDQGDAQALLSEFDAFVGGLAPEYANVPLNAEYSALVRYLLLVALRQPDRAIKALGASDVDADASLMRQVGATLHARRLTQLGHPFAARKVITPLLQVSGSSPRVLLPALLIAAETGASEWRDDLLRRAVGLATWNVSHAAFTFAPADVRSTLAALLAERGEAAIAERLLSVVDNTAIAGSDALTRREAAVIEAALAGLTNLEISASQHVSVNTVKSHMRTAYRKLGVSTRSQLHQLFHLGR